MRFLVLTLSPIWFPWAGGQIFVLLCAMFPRPDPFLCSVPRHVWRRRYTPAQLEQLCAECDTVDLLLATLQENARQHAATAEDRALTRATSLRRGTSLRRQPS